MLFVRDVEEKKSNYVIHSLHVTDLVIVVGIGFEYIIEFIISSLQIFSPESEFCQSPVDVLSDIFLHFCIAKLDQLRVDIVSVCFYSRLDVQELDPEFSSVLIGSSLIYNIVANLEILASAEWLFLIHDYLPICWREQCNLR